MAANVGFDAKDWIAIGSFAIALAAFWRTGRVRTLDLRTKVRKDAAELRVTLEDLQRKIPFRIQSRQNAWTTIGLGQSGAMEEFKQGANDCIEEIKGLLVRLEATQKISLFITYGQVEDKAVDLESIRTRTRQLLDKFAAAAQEDESVRAHTRHAALDRVARGHPGRKNS